MKNNNIYVTRVIQIANMPVTNYIGWWKLKIANLFNIPVQRRWESHIVVDVDNPSLIFKNDVVRIVGFKFLVTNKGNVDRLPYPEDLKVEGDNTIHLKSVRPFRNKVESEFIENSLVIRLYSTLPLDT